MRTYHELKAYCEGKGTALPIQPNDLKLAAAEISFKAGQETERRELNYCEKHKLYYCDCCPNCFEEKGIREVVEWIPELIQGIKDKMWEDDWGVKGVIYEGQLDALVKRKVKAQLKEWGM